MVLLFLLGISRIALGSNWWNNQLDWAPRGGTTDWFDPNGWVTTGNWQDPLPQPDFPLAPPDMANWAAIEAKGRLDINTLSPYYGVYSWPTRSSCLYNTSNTGAMAGQLLIHPWSWQGVTNCQVVMVHGDANMGNFIGLCTLMPFDSTTWGYAQLDVNGGTMYTGGSPNIEDYLFPCDLNDSNLPAHSDWWGPTGLQLGNDVGGNWGIVNINGGNLIVPRINILYGDINVLSGMLYQNDTCDTYFSISLNRQRNRINVAGGELRLKGARSDRLNYYIGKNRICPCEFHGTLVMDYNATDDYTSLTAICTPDAAWWPKPIDGADRQSLDPTLTWKPGPWAQVDACDGGKHGVYFGLSEANVTDANDSNTEFKGRQDPCSYVPGHLLADTWYYWRIDEYNNAAHDGNTMWKGNVWSFKTKGPVAGEPNPISGTIGLNIPLQLSWGAGAFAASTNGHILFIGPNETDVTDALYGSWPASVRRFILTDPNFKLSSLDYDLAADTNYYWRIDETNDNVNVPPDPTKYWANTEIWNFLNTNYFIVDNFDICPLTESFEDMNNRWKTGYKDNFEKFTGKGSKCSNGNFNPTHAGLGWETATREGLSTGVMIFNYDNKTVVNSAFSEARLECNSLPAGAKDWTGGGALPDNDKAKSIAISYLGASRNDYNPTYDVMYMALEANDGNFGMALQSDPEAQRTTVWDQWEVNFAEVKCPNPSDQTNIDYFYLGFGQRCNKGLSATGGTGTVRFDDLRLYQKHCVPAYAEQMGLSADISDDCRVNLDDIDVLATNWLVKQVVVVPVTPPAAEMLWYKFDETTGTAITDWSGNGYAGKVDSNGGGTTPEMDAAESKQLWDTGGKNGGCIDINYLVVTDFNVWIDANMAAMQYLANNKKSFSLSVWINGDVYMPLSGYPRLISVSQDFNTTPWVDDNEAIEIWCPRAQPGTGSVAYFRLGRGGSGSNDNNSVMTPGQPLSAFAGSWQNWIFVRDGEPNIYDANKMRIYHNGERVADANKLSAPMLATGVAIEHFRMGRLNQGAESWLGKIDDFKIYDYALSDAQAGYIGTGGTGYVPFVNVANIKSSTPEIVNFGDFAIIGQQWMMGPILWP
jgi:hypothetical protein